VTEVLLLEIVTFAILYDFLSLLLVLSILVEGFVDRLSDTQVVVTIAYI